MPVMFYNENEGWPPNRGWIAKGGLLRRSIDDSRPDLVIALLNNMPDAALEATERQFQLLLNAASPGIAVKLVLCRMDSVPRSEAAEAYLRCRSYVGIDAVLDAEIDGLIVTGREPFKHDLRDETWWESFEVIIEWSREKTISTIWSCLAAHAAVLYLDGVQRIRSKNKHCGIYNCSRISDHSLVAHVPAYFRMPHSRWNGLQKEELVRLGYELLTVAADTEVDCFLRQQEGESLFLFFQGHPEYQPDTLLLEYRRDLLRYLRGEAAAWPGMPSGILARKDEAALQEIQNEAHALSEEECLVRLTQIFSNATIENGWHGTAKTIYRNWLEYLSTQRNIRAASREPAAMELPVTD